MQELTTRRAFVQDVLGEWSLRATWRGAVYGAVGFAALAVWKGIGGIRVMAIASVLGACLGALLVLLLAAALRIASHPFVLSFSDRLGWWATAPPEDFMATHVLPCGRVRWPAQVEGGVLYIGVGRVAFAPYRHRLFGRTVSLGPGVEVGLSELAAALHWLLPLPSHVLELRDSSKCVRFLVARPSEIVPTVAAIVRGE